jgi:peptidoglycan/xylan/chitin deacetylase (PgdA/CDA1 family)
MAMNRTVTIVMYHYVRDLERSRFPAIKGLSIDRFRKQLDYIQSHFTFVTIENLMEAMANPGMELPPNPILLTFDDGYSDHFSNVFPLLDARGVQGCFYPSAQPLFEHRVLEVNKIQFVLAAVPDAGKLLDEVFALVDELRCQFALKAKEDYLAAIAEKHRYDSREILIVKRLLQRELPEGARAEIVRRLFAKYVTPDEEAFACELYMSMDQLVCLKHHGMHIGSHGNTHLWLNHVSPEVQAAEIDSSLEFLEKIQTNNGWTICYPYGGFNDSLLQLLQDRQCCLGFGVEPRIANLDVDHRLTLPRIDTNDLPS